MASRTHFLRVSIFVLHAIAPVSILWTALAACLYPVPPTVVVATIVSNLLQPLGVNYCRIDRQCHSRWWSNPFSQAHNHSLVDILYEYDKLSTLLTVWTAIESVWLVIHWVGRKLVAQGVWDHQGTKEVINSEERWRLFVKMVESHEDPWSWLHGFFALKKRAPRGIIDPCITKVRIEDVGQTNVKEFLAHFMFSKQLKHFKRDSTESAELKAMVLLLESALSRTRPGFKFLKGRSRHHVMLLNDEPIRTSHHPLVFYSAVWIVSELGNTALWLWGFKYYGPKRTWPFPLFFMRGSRRALEKLHDIEELKRMGSPKHANRVGYWFCPGSSKAQEEALTPILFFHGISGTYGPTPFLLYLCWRTGRPAFMPEMPYVAMRLSPPSAIRTRVEMVACCRRMLWRHGFGVTWEQGETNADDSFVSSDEEQVIDDDDNSSVDSDLSETSEIIDNDDEEEDWRRGRAIIVGHSLGGGPCSWILRDAPDVVAGVVLLDPMSPLLYSSDTARNFFRTKCRTAGEIFFRYFASERGINHFLSRHIAWSDAVVFGPKPVSPLDDHIKKALVPSFALTELEPPFDRPNYGQYITPYPQGPFPTFVFLSENDCILPFKQQHEYLIGSGMTKESIKVMPGLEHAALLIRPGWGNEVAKSIDLVAKAGDDWLHQETEDEGVDDDKEPKMENGDPDHESKEQTREIKLEEDLLQQNNDGENQDELIKRADAKRENGHAMANNEHANAEADHTKPKINLKED
ncbi:hypothetical protein OIO90_001271 [Microbotryomycetes sp. JL221]|nr:hypothetical protein OIO90_001271 [Microbotryomycetes sp. JL221]